MISGSALSPWAIASDAIYHARNFAKILGCLENPRMEKMVLECLRHKTIEDILSIDLKIPTHLTAFGPIIDGIVIPNDPQSLMSKSNPLFGSYELLFGVVKTESYNLFSNYDEQYGLDLSRRDRLLRTLIRNLFNYHLQVSFFFYSIQLLVLLACLLACKTLSLNYHHHHNNHIDLIRFSDLIFFSLCFFSIGNILNYNQ